MRELLWTIIGLAGGVRAVSRSRVRVRTLRRSGKVFGEGHLTDLKMATPIAASIGALIFFLASQKLIDDWEMVAYGILIWKCLQLVLIDIDTHVLPRVMILSTLVIGVGAMLLASLTGADGSVITMGVGSVGMWAILKVLEVVSRGDLGGGDVTLGLLLGAYLGWGGLVQIPIALIVAFLSAGLTAVVLLVARRANRRTMLPFGPFLIFGTLVAVIR